MNKMYRNFRRRFINSLMAAFVFHACLFPAPAQSTQTPLTSQELVRMVQQLPAHPEKKEELIEEIRKRGIGFELTQGLRAVVASKSGNDALLRRTLEEAARRRLNPVTSALPPEAEARDLLARTRVATLAASEAMPDFIVRQLITRAYSRPGLNNWSVADRLTIAVSFRAQQGEEYKLIAVNGLPPNVEVKEGQSYEQLGGASSTGEYVSRLAMLFLDDSKTDFRPVDTDTLRGRRTIVYEYEIKKSNSRAILTVGERAGQPKQQTLVGDRGRIWIDRETNRVLRLESISTEIPAGFPITEASRNIDYDWVTIAERQYLLPSRAEVFMTARFGELSIQSRNEIRFRGYQKFGTEVKIIEDVDETEEPPPGENP
ncbi:MAG TPA: hypothetical protein VE842_04115 [Pyrinomonadaceae bacterium]|nr:hypothetical protein [Pyrinomonadaceae bacterium]